MSANINVTTAFFEALAIGDDAAMDILREAAVPDDGPPSPRAQELIDTGEWDAQLLLSLVPVSVNGCIGLVGRGIAGESRRFCPKVECRTPAHQIKCEGITVPGWFIDGGARADSGVFADYRLPTADDGGPIPPGAAARLVDRDTPFRLSKGQWKFLIAEWHAGRVEALSSEDDSEVGGETQPTAAAGAQLPLVDTNQPGRFFGGRPRSPAQDQREPRAPSPVDDIGRLRQDFDTRLALLEGGLTVNEERLTRLQDAYDERFTNLQETFEGLERRLLRLERVPLANLLRRMDAIERDGQAARNTDPRALRAITDRLAELERTSLAGGGGIDPESQRRLDDLEHALTHPSGELQRLKSRFESLREKLDDGGGLECHGARFSSKKELAAWFDAKSLDVGVFCDAIALLHAVQAPVVFSDEAVRSMESRKKTKLQSPMEQAVITSFATVLPGILVGNAKIEGVAGGVYDWLSGYLKKRSVWKPSGHTTGVRSQILDGVSNVQRRIEQLRDTVSDDPTAHSLSVGLMGDSAQFLRELVNFVDEVYDELIADSAYSEATIWDMVVECLATIFEELAAARSCVADAANYRTGLYLWGMIKAWEVQSRLLRNKIKDDPTLTGILVRRVVLHGSDSSVKAKLALIEPLQKTAKDHQGEINTLRKQIKELKEKS